MITITLLDLRKDLQKIGKQAYFGQSFSVTYRGNTLFDIVQPKLKSKKVANTNSLKNLLATVKKIEIENKDNKSQLGLLSDQELDEYIFGYKYSFRFTFKK